MHLVELAFGHCRSDGRLVPIHQIALAEQRALIVFSHCFRGSQVHHPLGAYLTTENRVVIEPSTVIRAYAQEVDSHLEQLLALCHDIANTLEQACVLLAIVRLQGTMQCVEPEATVAIAKQPVLTSSLTSNPETLGNLVSKSQVKE